MINPTVFLKKAERLVPTKANRKGFRPRHSITLDDDGYLCLTIVINHDKRKFFKLRIDNNSSIEVLLRKHEKEILKEVAAFPVK